jgi:hypothetical protein
MKYISRHSPHSDRGEVGSIIHGAEAATRSWQSRCSCCATATSDAASSTGATLRNAFGCPPHTATRTRARGVWFRRSYDKLHR